MMESSSTPQDDPKLYPDLPVVSSLVGFKRKAGSGVAMTSSFVSGPADESKAIEEDYNKENESVKKSKVSEQYFMAILFIIMSTCLLMKNGCQL